MKVWYLRCWGSRSSSCSGFSQVGSFRHFSHYQSCETDLIKTYIRVIATYYYTEDQQRVQWTCVVSGNLQISPLRRETSWNALTVTTKCPLALPGRFLRTSQAASQPQRKVKKKSRKKGGARDLARKRYDSYLQGNNEPLALNGTIEFEVHSCYGGAPWMSSTTHKEMVRHWQPESADVGTLIPAIIGERIVVSSRLHSWVLLEAVDSSLANSCTNKPNTLRSVYQTLNSTPRAYLDALDGFWPVCL
ncbi:hypothetical protein QR685DRAFT_339 [Neurospora intermedia]|uniref:Uncharacterized protein n=1 Tax=Neurospora intermedia TaxID=5142 RepID=A0ABR3DNG3_NEUIN